MLGSAAYCGLKSPSDLCTTPGRASLSDVGSPTATCPPEGIQVRVEGSHGHQLRLGPG